MTKCKFQLELIKISATFLHFVCVVCVCLSSFAVLKKTSTPAKFADKTLHNDSKSVDNYIPFLIILENLLLSFRKRSQKFTDTIIPWLYNTRFLVNCVSQVKSYYKGIQKCVSVTYFKTQGMSQNYFRWLTDRWCKDEWLHSHYLRVLQFLESKSKSSLSDKGPPSVSETRFDSRVRWDMWMTTLHSVNMLYLKCFSFLTEDLNHRVECWAHLWIHGNHRFTQTGKWVYYT